MARPLAVAVCALALTAPGATAATLTPGQGCAVAGQPVTLAGAAFTPESAVTLAGAGAGTVTTDPAGAFAATVAAPRAPVGKVARTTVTATDASGVAASATLSSTAQRAWTNAPVTGTPTQRVTWRFAGFFTPGRAIYAHVRFGGRTLASHRFGLPRGACGTLTARAARVPLRRASALRAGVWRIKLDQARTYRPSTPGRVLTFRISRG
jgi:hypothetical protein